MIEVEVKVDMSGFGNFRKTINAGLAGADDSNPIRAALRQWGARFRSFVQERFVKFSRGGGDWPPLKPATQARRRGARAGSKGPRAFSLLRDTGTLFNALSPTFDVTPGKLQEDIPFGIKVGYGGPARHPKGTATIADLARFHQTGAGRLPVRKIIVEPDQPTIDRMRGDMERAIAKLIRDTGSDG